MLHLCVCVDLLQFVSLSRFMLLNKTLWLTVTHAFKGKEPSWQTGPNESALHFQVVFFSLLTSNWEVSTGRSLNSFLIISEITKHYRHNLVY